MAQPVSRLPARERPCGAREVRSGLGVDEERLSLKEGFKLTDLPHGVAEGTIRAFYNFGEDPLQTEPDTAQMRATLEGLEPAISQDIFITQTTALADVVLPPATSWAEHDAVYTASDRSFQRTTAALPPKGECRHDWQIFADLSTRMGYPMTLPRHPGNLGRSAQPVPPVRRCRRTRRWPARAARSVADLRQAADDPDNHGTAELFAGGIFTTPDGKGRLEGGCATLPKQPHQRYPAGAVHGARGGWTTVPFDDRQLQSAGSAGRRAGLREHQPGRRRRARYRRGRRGGVASRRGKVLARAAVDERINDGAVYMTYQWWIGKRNELTLHATDGESGTPEDKYSACQVEAIPDQAWAETYLAGALRRAEGAAGSRGRPAKPAARDRLRPLRAKWPMSFPPFRAERPKAAKPPESKDPARR